MLVEMGRGRLVGRLAREELEKSEDYIYSASIRLEYRNLQEFISSAASWPRIIQSQLFYRKSKYIYVNSQSHQYDANREDIHATKKHTPPTRCPAFEDRIRRRRGCISRYYSKSTITHNQASGSL